MRRVVVCRACAEARRDASDGPSRELGHPVSAQRRQALRDALRQARAITVPEALTASAALLKIVASSEGVTRTELVQWRRCFRLDPCRAEKVIAEALSAGQVHEEKRFSGSRGRPIRYLLPGTRVTEVLRTLAGGELRALRTAAELTPAQLASRLGVSAGAIRGWETGSATIPLARASEIRRVVEDRGRETSPTDEAAREILAVVARHPDIGRTELFEHHVGDRELSRAGLVRALEDGLVHEILVELPRRGPYYGLRAGRPELTPEPAWGGADLRRERQVLGLTSTTRWAVGVTTSTVSGWETGKRIPGHRAAALREALALAAARPTGDVDRALRVVTSAVERQPGEWTAAALLTRLRRKGAKAALRLALVDGLLHEEHQLTRDSRGRPMVRVRLYPGPSKPVEALPSAPAGQEILEIRRRAGASQRELATLVGVTWSAIGLWEKGRPVPPGRRAALCDTLEVLQSSPGAPRGRRLPRQDRPSVAQLVAEQPGITRGKLYARVNRKRRSALADELAEAIASGLVCENRVGRRVELFPT